MTNTNMKPAFTEEAAQGIAIGLSAAGTLHIAARMVLSGNPIAAGIGSSIILGCALIGAAVGINEMAKTPRFLKRKWDALSRNSATPA